MSRAAMSTDHVMRVLTIVGVVFAPLTFIAGVYGMNFDVMPELRWAGSYPVVLAVMLSLVVAMLLGFWRRRWFAPG
jgi:magnesium transporter